MLSTAKTIARQMLRKLGVEVRSKASTWPPAGTEWRPVGSTQSVLEDMHARGYRPYSIVDGGANSGEWAEMAVKIFPFAKFIMVEPLPQMQIALNAFCQNHPGSGVVVPAALGRKVR